MRPIRPRSPYEGLTFPRRQPPTRSGNRIASRIISDSSILFSLGEKFWPFRDFSSLRTHPKGPLIVIDSASILGSAF